MFDENLNEPSMSYYDRIEDIAENTADDRFEETRECEFLNLEDSAIESL